MKFLFANLTLLFAVVWSPAVQSVPCAEEIVSVLKDNAYLSELKDPDFLNAGLIAKLDPEEFSERLRRIDRYASYASADSFEKMKNVQKVAPAGVGMDIIRDRNGNVRCIPYPGSPADLAGVVYGDVLLAVDDLVVDDFSVEEVAFLVRGRENSEVTLTIEDEDGRIVSITVERAQNAYSSVVRTMHNPAVIKIFRFGTKTAKLLKKELESFISEEGNENRRLFIDLRGNTGGLLEQAAQCAAMLLPGDSIIYRLNKKGSVTDIKTDGKQQIIKKRFAVLQDEFTASSAEMLITAVRGAAGSRTYGTRTTGKARVQDIFTLSDGSVIKFTTGELMYPGTGDTWQDAGLEPDIVKKQIKSR